MRILRRFLARVKNFAMGQRSREFGISPLDATSFCSSVVLLELMSVAACVIPALRSVRLDPVRALRSE